MHPVVFGAALTGVGVRDVLAAVATYLPPRRWLARRSPARERLQDRAGRRRPPARVPPDARRHAHLPRRRGPPPPRSGRRGDARFRGGRSGWRRTPPVPPPPRRRPSPETSPPSSGYPTPRSGTSSGAGTRRTGCASSRRPDSSRSSSHGTRTTAARLYEAVQRLSAQDPLIDARLDGPDKELTVSLYGEVQREVLTARLAEEFGIVADVLESRTVLVERVAGVGEWALQVPTGNASVAYRIEPGLPGSGGEVRDGHRARVPAAGAPPCHRGDGAARAGDPGCWAGGSWTGW